MRVISCFDILNAHNLYSLSQTNNDNLSYNDQNAHIIVELK